MLLLLPLMLATRNTSTTTYTNKRAFTEHAYIPSAMWSSCHLSACDSVMYTHIYPAPCEVLATWVPVAQWCIHIYTQRHVKFLPPGCPWLSDVYTYIPSAMWSSCHLGACDSVMYTHIYPAPCEVLATWVPVAQWCIHTYIPSAMWSSCHLGACDSVMYTHIYPAPCEVLATWVPVAQWCIHIYTQRHVKFLPPGCLWLSDVYTYIPSAVWGNYLATWVPVTQWCIHIYIQCCVR